jgi:beta-glucanase (GH16 family)
VERGARKKPSQLAEWCGDNACWAGPQGASPAWATSKKPITKFDDPDWSKKFHVWRMDWDQQSLKLYVDGELLNTVDLSKTIKPGPEKINPFTKPHYILINMAIGGTAGGDPSKTEFPARLEVDYVRVYQKIASAPATVTPVQSPAGNAHSTVRAAALAINLAN